MNENGDVIVIGAGLAGAALSEQFASVSDKRVVLIERESSPAGHCRDYIDSNGICIHEHGPHIFHTANTEVWKYLHQFTDWYPYIHKVEAMVDGRLIPIPFNYNSLEICFSPIEAVKTVSELNSEYGDTDQVGLQDLRYSSNPTVRNLGDFVYEKIFLNYTKKQWGGRKPEELDPSVIARVPVRLNRDNRYFSDPHQGIPVEGYSTMIRRMIDHHNIEFLPGTDAAKVLKIEGAQVFFDGHEFTGPVICTGMTDQILKEPFGALPYRSLRMEVETMSMELFQKTAVVNYPNDGDFTRITEFKHFHGCPETDGKTTVAREYPAEYARNINRPYYTIPGPESARIAEKYTEYVASIPNFYTLGRLGEYRYYNMDEVVAGALSKFREIESA